jgi:hypothetical protein
MRERTNFAFFENYRLDSSDCFHVNIKVGNPRHLDKKEVQGMLRTLDGTL